MKARNREVNIFNMSLLDILCGALGAFCFMMLVLFPYWRPGGADRKQIEENSQQMQQNIEQLRQQLKNSPNSGAVAQQLNQLQQKMQQQQGQLNQALQKLDEANKEIGGLQMRNPITIGLEWHTANHDLDLYTQWQVNPAPGKKGPPAVDPNQHQFRFYADETDTQCNYGPCWEVWMFRDVPPKLELKIWYKFFAANGNPQPAKADGWYIWNGTFTQLPRVEMDHEKTAIYVGSLMANSDYTVHFTPAPELAAEYRRQLEEGAAQTQKK
jgi:hypothetical protein